MLIDQLSNSGALPTLELTMRFAAQRQRLIAHNIANIDTPNFIPKDVSVAGFQRVLDRAIRDRRAATGGMQGELPWGSTRELQRREGTDELVIQPNSNGDGVLYHDRNNRDTERLMQSLAETTAAFRVASDLYRAHVGLLHAAISERV